MVTYRIPAGRHRALPLRFGLYWKRSSFKWHVLFEESCRYNLLGDDQFDTNKLIGVGYLPGHHYESARFGWRYRTEQGEIELLAYCYVNGRRIIQPIGFCAIDKWYKISLFTSKWQYLFLLDEIDGAPIGTTEMKHYNYGRLGYRLGVFFGGQKAAPHEIKIQIEKV